MCLRTYQVMEICMVNICAIANRSLSRSLKESLSEIIDNEILVAEYSKANLPFNRTLAFSCNQLLNMRIASESCTILYLSDCQT